MADIKKSTLGFIASYCKKHKCKECDLSYILLYPDGRKYHVCRLNTKPSKWFEDEEVTNGKN